MEVILFGVVGLAFVALFFWGMLVAARSGSIVIASLCGVFALSNPIALIIPFILAGGTNTAIGILLLAALAAGTAWLGHRAYRAGVSARCTESPAA